MRVVLSFVIFFFLTAGVTYASGKLARVSAYAPLPIHDKPSLCTGCKQLMWSGPEAHSCPHRIE